MGKETDTAENIKQLPIFFIIGSPRSGTTMLRTIFDAHPNVCIPLENPFFLFFYDKYHHKQFWDKTSLELLCDEIFSLKNKEYWSFAKWKIDRDQLKSNILQLEGNYNFGDICNVLFLNFNSVFPKSNIKLIGDKNPAYSFVIPQLQSVFPDAKFIHIIRDFRDHILSMQKVDFGSKLTPFTAMKWKKCQKTIERKKTATPEIFYSVRYEDLVSKPKEQLKSMCEFLGLEYIPETINFSAQKDALLTTYREDGIEQYHSSIIQPITASKIGTWKNKMPEKEIKIADAVTGKWAEKYGYERKFKKTYPLLYFYIIPIYLHLGLQKFLWFFIRMLPHKTKNKIVYRASLFEKIYEKIYVRIRRLKDQEKSNNRE